MEKTEKKDLVRGEQKNRRDIMHFDYKNIEQLKEYINPHARILNRRRTELLAGDQRRLAEAVKRARTMALMPYLTR
jgi:small subunit ribosomal protein S18